MIKASFPKALKPLFKPGRYKFVRGGRGSGKSWGVARALLLMGMERQHRILCTREIQKSIKQSVHQLLKDQVDALGLHCFYEVFETEIRGANGSIFRFSGLSDQTSDSIKSFEGCTIVWIEEGQSISKNSWKILAPTIRAQGSEIWVTYNPQLDSDETHIRAVIRPHPDTITIEINYMDNPWFPDGLEEERLHAQKTMTQAEYEHVWLGKCMPAVEGAIYFDEISKAQEDGRICRVPYDPMLKVHVVFDLGWNDSMSICLVQKSYSEIRIIDYIEDSRRTLDDYSAQLKDMRLNWGQVFLPHDARQKDYKSGKSAEQIMRALGWDVAITPSLSVEDGIRAARMTFPRVIFDKEKSERLIECLKRYRRDMNQKTQEAGKPLHDEYSHGADCFRYVAVNADGMSNESWGKPINYPKTEVA